MRCGISWYRSPWLGVQEIGNSGFRFVRIDVLGDSTELQLKESPCDLHVSGYSLSGLFPL